MPTLTTKRSIRAPSASQLAKLTTIACLLSTTFVAYAEAPNADEKIETIVVKAARVPLPAVAVGTAISLLDGDELTNRQVVAVSEVLRSRPGIAVNRAGGLGALTQVRLRGGEANQVAVYIDGIPVNDPAQGNEFNFAHLLNTDIGSLEIIRGPQSALWGSDAISGVINVQSQRAEPGFRADVLGEAGSDNYRTVKLTTSYADNELSSSFAIAHSESSGDNIARTQPDSSLNNTNDGYSNTNASLRLDYRYSPTIETGIRLRYIDANNEFDATDFTTGLLANSGNETDTNQFYGRAFVAVSTLQDRLVHQLSINLIDTENENLLENAFAATGFDESSADSKTYQYSLQSSFTINPNHRVSAALEYQNQRFEQRGPIVFGDPNRDETLEWSSFVGEYQGSFGESLSILASVRHDDNTDFDNATTARLSAAWWPSGERTRLRGAVGSGVKNPTFTERFGFDNNFIGNPDLQPERSIGWEIGVDQYLFNNSLAISATWFDERLEDEINGFVFDPSTVGFTSANGAGESDRAGLELEARWQLNETLSLALAYTYLDATEEDAAGNQVREIRRAEHIANASVQFSPLQGLSVNLNVDYNGEQEDFFFPPTPPFQERVTLDDFVLVNLAASYNLSSSLAVFGRVENLFDEDYEEVFSFTTPGRSAVIGLRYRAVER